MPTCEVMGGQEVWNNLPKVSGEGWSWDCNPGNAKHGATSINTLQNSWCDYRNPERKYFKKKTESPGCNALHFTLSSLSYHPEVFPFRLSQRPSLSSVPPSHLDLWKEVLSKMTIWFLISPPTVQSGSRQHKQKHPLPPRTQRNRQFFLWILFPEVA